MNLAEANRTWKQRLASEACPPLLGLAPLHDAESAQIASLVREELHRAHFQPHCDTLVGLLRLHPAVMAVWLSRVAGVAYDAHNFWSNFAGRLDFHDFTQNQRERLAGNFRRACQSTMSGFVEPEVGSWRLAGQFLFQAGLPLCHCGRFTQAMRAVALDLGLGLPDPEDADAMEDFRTAMLARVEIQQAPVVANALAAASGPHLLRAALRVVREESYENINPALGEKLRGEFAQVARGSGLAALRSPFLRLAEDCVSFELVGPTQTESLIAGRGLAPVYELA